MSAKTTPKPTAKKRIPSPRTKARPRRPAHNAIATRAYFIHLEEGTRDEVANWLRAEHELTAA